MVIAAGARAQIPPFGSEPHPCTFGLLNALDTEIRANKISSLLRRRDSPRGVL